MAILGLVVVVVVGVLVAWAGTSFVGLAQENRTLTRRIEHYAYAAGRTEQVLTDLVVNAQVFGETQQVVASALRDLRNELDNVIERKRT